MNELTPDERKILVDAIQDSATVVHKGQKDMNLQIKELWSQAGGCYDSGNQHTWPQYTIDNPEKFAELIVKECARVAGRDVGHFVLEHFGVE